jgi:hypothetical protein
MAHPTWKDLRDADDAIALSVPGSKIGVETDAEEVDGTAVAVVAGVPDVLVVEAYPQTRHEVPTVVCLDDALGSVIELAVTEEESLAAESEIEAVRAGQAVQVNRRTDRVALATPQSTVDEHAGGKRAVDLGERIGLVNPSLTKSCLFRSFLTCRASETRVVVRGGWAKQNVVP